MKIVIEGAGEIGSHLAKMLSREANEITVIDPERARLDRLVASADVAVVQGHSSSIRVLKKAGVGSADLFIAVNPFVSQEVNIVSALLAKRLGAAKVTARVDDEECLTPDNKLIFKSMGIELMFFPEKIAADEILAQLRHTASTDNMDFAHGKLQISVFKLEEDSPLLDMNIADFASLATSDDIQFRVIAISRGDDTIIPKSDTRFKYHDLVFIIAKREGVQMLMKYLGKSNMEVNRLMIYGGTEMGEQVAKAATGVLDEIKLVEKDRDRCHDLTEILDSQVTVVNGDGKNPDFLVEESIRDYDAFAALTGSDETNVLACVMAKRFGVGLTIADIENVEYIRLAEDMGVDCVINKKLLTAGKIFKFTLSDKARFVKYMSGTSAEVLEYVVAPKSKITSKPLKDIGFPRNAVIGGLIRGSEAQIAIGSTQIEAYDRVAVFALPEAVKEEDKFFK